MSQKLGVLFYLIKNTYTAISSVLCMTVVKTPTIILYNPVYKTLGVRLESQCGTRRKKSQPTCACAEKHIVHDVAFSVSQLYCILSTVNH